MSPRFLFPDATAALPPQGGGGVLVLTAPSPASTRPPRRMTGNP